MDITLSDEEMDILVLSMEAASETLEQHGRLLPGQGAGTCGDKFCTYTSHDTMVFRAGYLDGMAARWREQRTKGRSDTRVDVHGAACLTCGAVSLGTLAVDHPVGSCTPPKKAVAYTNVTDDDWVMAEEER